MPKFSKMIVPFLAYHNDVMDGQAWWWWSTENCQDMLIQSQAERWRREARRRDTPQNLPYQQSTKAQPAEVRPGPSDDDNDDDDDDRLRWREGSETVDGCGARWWNDSTARRPQREKLLSISVFSVFLFLSFLLGLNRLRNLGTTPRQGGLRERRRGNWTVFLQFLNFIGTLGLKGFWARKKFHTSVLSFWNLLDDPVRNIQSNKNCWRPKKKILLVYLAMA